MSAALATREELDASVWVSSGGSVSDLVISGNEFWGEAGIHPGDAAGFMFSDVTDNIFHNNASGIALAGMGLNVTGNYLCSSGAVSVTGSTNTVGDNPGYTDCSDAPSTTTPPPLYPPA